MGAPIDPGDARACEHDERAALATILETTNDPVLKDAYRRAWEKGRDRALEQAQDAAAGRPSKTTRIANQYERVETTEIREGRVCRVCVVAGFDGRKGCVDSRRDFSAQRALSRGTGDDSSHARPAGEGLDLFNRSINRGEINRLDNAVYQQLERGDRVFTVIKAYYNPNRAGFADVRPTHYERTETTIALDGKSRQETIAIGNFSSSWRRAAARQAESSASGPSRPSLGAPITAHDSKQAEATSTTEPPAPRPSSSARPGFSSPGRR